MKTGTPNSSLPSLFLVGYLGHREGFLDAVRTVEENAPLKASLARLRDLFADVAHVAKEK